MFGILALIGVVTLAAAGGWRFGFLGGTAAGTLLWGALLIFMAAVGESGGDLYSFGAALTLPFLILFGVGGAALKRVVEEW
jgi:hypothetical protein